MTSIQDSVAHSILNLPTLKDAELCNDRPVPEYLPPRMGLVAISSVVKDLTFRNGIYRHIQSMRECNTLRTNRDSLAHSTQDFTLIFYLFKCVLDADCDHITFSKLISRLFLPRRGSTRKSTWRMGCWWGRGLGRGWGADWNLGRGCGVNRRCSLLDRCRWKTGLRIWRSNLLRRWVILLWTISRRWLRLRPNMWL